MLDQQKYRRKSKGRSIGRRFSAAATEYRVNGFLGTLPLPPAQKCPPPSGFTGGGRPHPDDEQVAEWIRDQPRGNIALRLAEVPHKFLDNRTDLPVVYAGNNVDGWELVGIDVDNYTKNGGGPKHGAAQLRDLEAELGALPATAISSSRWDTTPSSGIRLFLVPQGFRYMGKAASAIEVIQKRHRFMVVAPSTNPDNGGARYEWRHGNSDPDSVVLMGHYPNVDEANDVAVLPEAWFSHLSRGGTIESNDPISELTDDELFEWAQTLRYDDEPCELMQRAVRECVEKLDSSESSHDKITYAHWRLFSLAAEGHSGVGWALNQFHPLWRDHVVSNRGDIEAAATELNRSALGALDKIQPVYDGLGRPDDKCAVDPSAFDCAGWAKRMNVVDPPRPMGAPTPLGDVDDADPDAGKYGWLSDANVSKLLVDEVLRGKYCFAAGFGWMKWDGHRWARTTDADVIERSRRFARRMVADAAKREEPEAIKAYTKRLASGAIAAAANLAKGQLLVQAADFDCHPDLLNVGNGVVDLRTGQLSPPDPALLLTKWTATDYDHDAAHPDWTAALSALPAGVREWAQVRLGQGITGHPTPDDVLVVFQGGGENGKSTITVGVNKSLGDHAVTVPERLLTANPSDHPTELMTLRGARLAMMEETPEARYLNVKRLKDVLGTPTMSARLIRQDNVSWTTTHSLFLSTNYRPRVSETDHGTWRRLMLARFPFTYRKAHEELTGPFDRRGDAGLRERVKLSPSKQHEAVLRWLVDGAMRWYADGQEMPPPPESVERDTRRWRQSSDPILELFDDCLIADAGYYIPSAELYRVFNDRLLESGQKAWSDKTFNDRFESHDEVKARRIHRDRVRPGSSELVASVSPLTRAVLPERLRAWTGVRFRTEADEGGDQVK